jgi:hypothetical protein
VFLPNIELRDTLACLSQGSKFFGRQRCREIMGHRWNMMRPVGRSTPSLRSKDKPRSSETPRILRRSRRGSTNAINDRLYRKTGHGRRRRPPENKPSLSAGVPRVRQGASDQFPFQFGDNCLQCVFAKADCSFST